MCDYWPLRDVNKTCYRQKMREYPSMQVAGSKIALGVHNGMSVCNVYYHCVLLQTKIIDRKQAPLHC